MPLGELEKASGGYQTWDEVFLYKLRFRFDEDEVKKIKEKSGKEITPRRTYTRGELNDIFDSDCKSGNTMEDYLYQKFRVIHDGFFSYD